jgi:predicted aspartyl protease
MRDAQTTKAQTPAPAPSTATAEPLGRPETPGRWRASLLVPLAIILVVVGIIGGIVYLSRQEQDAGGTVLASGSVDSATLPVTVPYREIGGAIVIDVTLGSGDRSLPMILDTGAPTILSEATARAYAGEAAGTVASISADGQVISNSVVPLARVSVGGAVFTDVGAVVGAIEPGNPFYCITDSGFIGASLMRTAVWQIDPQARHVTIAGSIDGLDHIDGATRLALTPASDISPSPLVELAVGEGTLTFLLDTGSNGWLVANPQDLAGIGVELPDDPPTMAILGSGAAGSVATQMRWLDAGIGADPLLLAVSEALPEGLGNAGTDYLWRFVVTIDWPGGSVYLDPVAELLPSEPPSAAVAWDEGYVVGSYVEGLDINAGLTLGADISSLDGRDVTQVPFDDFCTRLLDDRPTYQLSIADAAPGAAGGAAPGAALKTVDVAPVEDFFGPLTD